MIKIEIQPAFESHCRFEIKPNGNRFHLMVMKYQSEYDGGGLWTAETTDSESVAEITDLVESLMTEPETETSLVISDGVAVKYTLEKNGSRQEYTCLNPVENSRSWQAVQRLFDLGAELIPDSGYTSYITSIEGYF